MMGSTTYELVQDFFHQQYHDMFLGKNIDKLKEVDTIAEGCSVLDFTKPIFNHSRIQNPDCSTIPINW